MTLHIFDQDDIVKLHEIADRLHVGSAEMRDEGDRLSNVLWRQRAVDDNAFDAAIDRIELEGLLYAARAALRAALDYLEVVVPKLDSGWPVLSDLRQVLADLEPLDVKLP